MLDLEYPKIDTLYDRKKNRKVDMSKLRRPEFALIKEWQLTEKLNGRNLRIKLGSDGKVEFAGRHDNKNVLEQIPNSMIQYLTIIFTPEKMKEVFWYRNKDPEHPELQTPEVCIYLEGIGSGLAAGSGIYCHGRSVDVRLLDCYIHPWWLERASLEDIASKFNINCAPLLPVLHKLPESKEDLMNIIKYSLVAMEHKTQVLPEGIVARTAPILFNKKGDRVMWKLKYKDME